MESDARMFYLTSNTDPKQPARSESKLQLAADLAGMKRLNELNQRLIGISSLETALKEILALAIEFAEADRGNIQLFKLHTSSLHIAAHQGHGQPFLDHFRRQGCSAVCEAALRAKNRVVVEDILSEPALERTKDQEVIKADGIRAVQSTPLVTREGKVIGMMSTHFNKPHRPTAEQFRFLDLVASIAAEFIERAGVEKALRESERKLKNLNHALERKIEEQTNKLRELIWAQKRLEEQKQQEIFRAVLDTQEAERKRMAESLHNSLGQILYGVKLSLGQLYKANLTDNEKDNLKKTDKLLNDAILESRRISHQLMPVTLEDFGLKIAVEDICRQLSQDVKFKFQFKGLIRRLDKYVEIAIYRIIQELMMNIVKHSGASESLVAVEVKKSQLLLLVQDNGKGFSPDAEKTDGIGLKTIRNKVSLLNGNINIVSMPGKGTVININLPVMVAT
ncbi:MAG TPA: GAF domain-containing sensor histidine kinase [Mucilaginibacter sp.]|nr:GAF domain-containing sensor histidine kinase [Mucilaginibacter sp.]